MSEMTLERSMRANRILLKAVQLALLEFDRISYQIKADESVIAVMKVAATIGEDVTK